MTIEINYKNNASKKNYFNNVFFVDEKFNISSLKRHIKTSEFTFISDLIKSK
jgi:leucyl aminopeptidase